LLAKAKITIKNGKALRTLFLQMSEQTEELKTSTLLRYLNQTTTVAPIANQTRTVDGVPTFVSDFVQHILDKKINLREVFKEQISSKLIDLRTFYKFLIDSEFAP
jgi:site-specific recombinase XerD